MSPRLFPLLLIIASLTLAGGAIVVAGGAAPAAAHPLDPSDSDHDGFKEYEDNCPKNYNPRQTDTDKDAPPNPVTEGTGSPQDRPADRGGDACDNDDDADGIKDQQDNCSLKPNKGQEDGDGDGVGDLCDADLDNDDWFDTEDNCPSVSNVGQDDTDKDGIGDACENAAAAGGSLRGRDPNDKTAPKATLRLSRSHLLGELNAGLSVGVRCSEGCVLDGQLSLPNGTARKLKLATKSSKKPFVLGRGAAQIEDKGTTFVFVGLSAKTLRSLARMAKVRPVLRLSVQDANGNRRIMSRQLTLRR